MKPRLRFSFFFLCWVRTPSVLFIGFIIGFCYGLKICMCFWYIPECLLLLFLGFQLNHFSNSKSIDGGYLVNTAPLKGERQKVPVKFGCVFIFLENRLWHFMQIICLGESLHEISKYK